MCSVWFAFFLPVPHKRPRPAVRFAPDHALAFLNGNGLPAIEVRQPVHLPTAPLHFERIALPRRLGRRLKTLIVCSPGVTPTNEGVFPLLMPVTADPDQPVSALASFYNPTFPL